MQTYILSILFLITGFLHGQSINQFDANGKRHGIWKKTFDGTKTLRYEGEFFHGKEIGLFKFYKRFEKKAVLSATKQFNKDNNIADIKFFTSKGKVVSEGQMDGRAYVGAWKYYQKRSDALLIIEHYNANGNLDGERLVYYENGQIAEKQFYNDGKLDGESFWYSESGVVLKQFIYKDGELHGMSKYYNPKGELITEGPYKNGKKHGNWKFYEDGKLVDEKNFTYSAKLKKKE